MKCVRHKWKWVKTAGKINGAGQKYVERFCENCKKRQRASTTQANRTNWYHVKR